MPFARQQNKKSREIKEMDRTQRGVFVSEVGYGKDIKRRGERVIYGARAKI